MMDGQTHKQADRQAGLETQERRKQGTTTVTP